MVRKPDSKLLEYLGAYDPHIASLSLALREMVLEEAPEALESLVKSYAVAVGFSFTGKPLKDGFCHVVTYADHVNLGFNRGAQLADPGGILEGSGKSIRHLTFRHHTELDAPYVRRFLHAAVEQAGGPPRHGESARSSAKASTPRPRKRESR